MKELSIFVDESGDFGDYAEHSSYYIISLIMHDQKNDIDADIRKLEQRLQNSGSPIIAFMLALSSVMRIHIGRKALKAGRSS